MTRRLALAALLPLLAACTQGVPAPPVVETPGSVALNQAPSNDVPLGGGGHGTVFFQGNLYPFSIGGLGVDGAGVAVLQTTGQTYQMRSIAEFPGTYRAVPAGTPLPSAAGGGLWLRNEHGTLLRITAPPQGQLPTLSNDALRVVMD
jgi:hypothetical protein